MDKKIIMLIGEGEFSNFMYHGIKDDFPISSVILEEKLDRKKFLKRRIKRLGYLKVLGQILFHLIVPKFLTISSQRRIEEIKSNYNLDGNPIPNSKLYKVQSVNSTACIDLIQKENPNLIIVNGTRIISEKVLNSTTATFVNTHVGITPQYRGVYGGYWALVNQDVDNCGVTVHLVDKGIDTGGVLFQQKIQPTHADNFVTYGYLQVGEGVTLMRRAISDFMENQLKEIPTRNSKSRLWYHPTIWFYFYKRTTKGVK